MSKINLQLSEGAYVCIKERYLHPEHGLSVAASLHQNWTELKSFKRQHCFKVNLHDFFKASNP